MKSPEERFWSHVTKTDSCWNWDNTAHHRGYGKIRIGSKKVFVHRFSYELHKSKIPEGMVIDHLCRNTACVNPAHLEIVNHKENVLRGIGPTALNARKEECSRGHKFSETNFYVSKSGGRYCMKCQVIRTREYRKRKSSGP